MYFVFGIFVAVVLGYLFPEWGSNSSPIPIDKLTSWGIALIFFFYGIKISFKQLKSGLSNWKLHLLVQFSTFLLFPLLILVLKPFASSPEAQDIWLSFFFLASLPSTVSSSVVMVSIARGNIPAAVFNASISGIIGILVTPLWIGLFVKSDMDFDFIHVYTQLLLEIVIPLGLGFTLQKQLNTWAVKNSKSLSNFDKLVILVIVYKSFADSFTENLFQSISWTTLILIGLGVVALFFTVYGIVNYVCRLLKLNEPERITALYCGSKKSLTHGTVFAQALFGNSTKLGLIILPLMLFHAFQIFIISIFAQKNSQKSVHK